MTRAFVDDALRARLVELRRSIHREPELAFQEHRTAEKLERALREAGITDIRRIGETGIVARVPGTQRGAPTIAIRGDMDALPITEETGLPFASTHPGVMHACGHDVHCTWAVGAAALLVRSPAPGDTVILLQPAEEVGRGANAMIAGGALDGVTAIYGAHVDRRFTLGQVVADVGPLAASADTFEIEVVGQGAHAARPHEARDPIVAAAALIGAIQTIVARTLNPATPGVVTVGQIAGGTAPNIIPDRVHLAGTVRAVDPESRRAMTDALHRIAKGVASAHDVRAEVTIADGTPPVVNPERETGWAREAAAAVLGPAALVPLGFLNLAAEDFGAYLERIPGCFLRIGAREDGGAIIPAHSPRFHPAEESIAIGAAVLAECARVASAASAAGTTSRGSAL